jgi:hypothetical protein
MRHIGALIARPLLVSPTLLLFGEAHAVNTTSASKLEAVVALVVGVAWPATLLLLIYFYRDMMKRILVVLERRLAQGDKVSAFGISMETRGAPLPVATSSGEYDDATSAIIGEILSLQPSSRVLIALGEMSSTADESAVIGLGDALGLALVQAKLLRVSGVSVTAAVVRKASSSISELLDRYGHVVSIGGPRANRLTEVIMGSNYLTFEFRSGGVYDKLEQKLNVVEFSADRMYGTDWAMLLIAGNPRNRDGRAVVIAGYSGYGTNASAAVFSRLDEFKELHGPGFREALIRVEISNGVVGDPEIMTVRDIPTVETVPF